MNSYSGMVIKAKAADSLDFGERYFAVAQLKHAGLAATDSRLKVLATFYSINGSRQSILDIYRTLQQNKTPVPFSTIYNALSRFAEKGILVARMQINGAKYYEVNGGDQPSHIVCYKCGQRFSFFNYQLMDACKKQLQHLGVESEEFSVSINGICKACAS
jgi:Fur family ferric uptake transcriptional regulator